MRGTLTIPRSRPLHYMLTQRAGESVTALDDIIASMDDEAIRKSSDLVREALSTLEMDPMFVITLFRPDGNEVAQLAAEAFARL